MRRRLAGTQRSPLWPCAVGLHVKRQPSFCDIGQRNAAFVSGLGFEHRDFRSCLTFDTDNSSFEPASMRRGQHVRPTSNEASPFLGGPQRPFARRRDLKHVLRRNQLTSIQASLQDARRAGAVVDGDGCSVTPIDSSFDQRTGSGPATPELHEIVVDRVKLRYDNRFQRVLHIESRKSSRTKKCGEPPPHFTRDHSGRAASSN